MKLPCLFWFCVFSIFLNYCFYQGIQSPSAVQFFYQTQKKGSMLIRSIPTNGSVVSNFTFNKNIIKIAYKKVAKKYQSFTSCHGPFSHTEEILISSFNRKYDEINLWLMNSCQNSPECLATTLSVPQ